MVKVNQLLSSLIVFIILFSFLLFLMSKKNISPFLSSRLLNLAKIKSAYKKDDEVFSERIISFNKRIFFSIFVIELALLFFFRVFLDIDRFHFKEENKINENLIESYNLNKKEELLRRLIKLKTDNEDLWVKREFFNRYKSLAFKIKNREELLGRLVKSKIGKEELLMKKSFNKYKINAFVEDNNIEGDNNGNRNENVEDDN